MKMILHLQSDTNVFSHVELDLPSVDWLSTVVVFEIQALVVTQTMRILNFFALNFGSPFRTQSSIIFSGLNFHKEWLVKLFVQDFLGDIINQNRILCESEENGS